MIRYMPKKQPTGKIYLQLCWRRGVCAEKPEDSYASTEIIWLKIGLK